MSEKIEKRFKFNFYKAIEYMRNGKIIMVDNCISEHRIDNDILQYYDNTEEKWKKFDISLNYLLSQMYFIKGNDK